tara:strand:- start:184 stop:375 length:192 start_codon:yes stop_codon:yes gene_type:complete
MNKIYPESLSKYNEKDENYNMLKSIVYSLCCCVCICVGILVLIIQSIEKDLDDNINNSSYLNK